MMNDQTVNDGGQKTIDEVAAAGQPPEQKPAIGRIVHFRRGTREPLPAIITKVHDDKTVDLTAFTGNPTTPVWVRQREKLIDPATDLETGWYWPPVA